MRITSLLILALAIQATPPEPTATIRGRVTDAPTGAPIANAIVMLNAGSTKPAATRTDDDGRYEFAGLTPGTYRVSAEPPQYRGTHVRADFADPAQPSARNAIALKAGEVRARVDIPLRRSVAIGGRVVDEWGLPVAGMTVVTKTLFAPHGLFPAQTDDRGVFRVFGLTPGRYFVCTDPEVFRRFSRMIAAPPRARSLPTCYPSATTEQEAVRVVVGQADVDGIEIRLMRGRTFTISGTVVDSTGAPPVRGTIELHRWSRTGSGSSGTSLSPDGRFTLKDLLPGEYVVSAAAGDMSDDYTRPERAYVRIKLEATDIEGVSLALVRAARVRGRLIFQDGPAPRAQGSGFMVSAVPPDLVDISRVLTYALVKPDLSFELADIVGPSVIAMENLPAGWVVQSVRYRGRDITDTLTAFSNGDDAVAMEILLTRGGGTLSGTVLDDSGAPAIGSLVLLFPADSAKWRILPPEPPHTASSKGGFQFEALRAGEYLVAALSADAAPAFPKPEFFERLSKVAERVVLGEGERRTIELHLVTVPER